MLIDKSLYQKLRVLGKNDISSSYGADIIIVTDGVSYSRLIIDGAEVGTHSLQQFNIETDMDEFNTINIILGVKSLQIMSASDMEVTHETDTKRKIRLRR